MDEELDLQKIRKRSVSGVVALTIRTGLIQVISLIATFILTVLLDPAIFGIFFVVSAVINLLVYFSDIGLAAALIQKKERPQQDDLSTTFIIQQAMVLSLIMLAFLLTPFIGQFYTLSAAGIWLYRVLLASLFLASLKTIPTIILERNLSFSKLIIPQIGENIVFNLLAVVLAALGFGLYSFVWAVLARGVTGLLLTYLIAPWYPSFIFNPKAAKRLMSFGLPYQTGSILALIKDDLLTIFLGKILPFTQVGYIGWAQKWSFFPLRFFLDNVNKVAFPTFSRLQGRRKVLKRAIEKSVFAVCFFTFPALVFLVILMPLLVEIIPRYQKWAPAVPLIYFFAGNAAISCISTTLTNVLVATGRVKTNLKLMIFWTTLTWLLTPILVFKIGFVGAAVSSFLVSLSSVYIIYLIKKIIKISIGQSVFLPLTASFSLAGFLFIFAPLWGQTFLGILALVSFGTIIYLLSAFGFSRGQLALEVKSLWRILSR